MTNPSPDQSESDMRNRPIETFATLGIDPSPDLIQQVEAESVANDLVKRLRIAAGMISMGELIAWGSDTALMREAASYIEALAASQAAPAKAEGCTWSLDDDESGTWASSCGELWGFIDGGPQENRVSFCHHCGGKVTISTPAKEPT